MLAAFAHHLRTALVLLDRNIAHGTALDEIGVEGDAGLHEIRAALLGQAPRVLLAGEARVPGVLAVGAEVRRARGAVDALGKTSLDGAAHAADSLAAGARTPRPVRVQVHLSIKTEFIIFFY